MEFELKDVKNGTTEVDLETTREMVVSQGQDAVQIEYASHEEVRKEYEDFLKETPDIEDLADK